MENRTVTSTDLDNAETKQIRVTKNIGSGEMLDEKMIVVNAGRRELEEEFDINKDAINSINILIGGMAGLAVIAAGGLLANHVLNDDSPEWLTNTFFSTAIGFACATVIGFIAKHLGLRKELKQTKALKDEVKAKREEVKAQRKLNKQMKKQAKVNSHNLAA